MWCSDSLKESSIAPQRSTVDGWNMANGIKKIFILPFAWVWYNSIFRGTMNFLRRRKKTIPIFRVHLTCGCDTTRDQVSSATVPQKHYAPAWTIPDPAGKKATVPGSMNFQTHSSQRLPTNNTLIAMRVPALRWVWGEQTWYLQWTHRILPQV